MSDPVLITAPPPLLAEAHPSERLTCREQFGLLLNELGLTDTALEVGTYIGEFAIPFLANWKGRRLHVVDPWLCYPEYQEDPKFLENLEEKFQIFQERTRMFAHRIQIHRMLSREAEGFFPANSLDFVYLDGNHAYEFVRQDLLQYWPKVRPGGIMAGHDFESHGVWAPHVRRAVLEFFGPAQLPVYYVSGDAHSWYVYKPPLPPPPVRLFPEPLPVLAAFTETPFDTLEESHGTSDSGLDAARLADLSAEEPAQPTAEQRHSPGPVQQRPDAPAEVGGVVEGDCPDPPGD